MKIILTGASGYLGSKLAISLLASGHDVSLLLRPGSKLDRLGPIASNLCVGRYHTDADIVDFVTKVAPDVVIHTACSYGRKDETPLQIHDANVRFGLCILQALDQADHAWTFFNCGTVLGPDINLYALTKNQFSQVGRAFIDQGKGTSRFINVALQHIYGPNDDPSKFTQHVLNACRNADPVLELTAGEQKRDFVYIDDVTSAFHVLVENREQLGRFAEIDVGSGIAPTIRAFVETIHRLTKSTTKLRFGALPYRVNEAMLCVADLSQMRRLGWAPQYTVEAGVCRTIELDMIR